MNLPRRMKPNAEFSSASIADIVFLLLIYFILTSKFVNFSSLEVDLPQGTTKDPHSAPNTITITPGPPYTYAWNNDVLGEEPEPLYIKIIEVLSDGDPDNNVIQLRIDKSVEVEELTKVMAVAKEQKEEGTIVIMTKMK